MKLVFYGLWEDERSKLEELHKKYGFDYEATAEELSLLNVSLSEGCAGVSVLGKGRGRRRPLKCASRLRRKIFGYPQHRL